MPQFYIAAVGRKTLFLKDITHSSKTGESTPVLVSQFHLAWLFDDKVRAASKLPDIKIMDPKMKSAKLCLIEFPDAEEA
jgi:hypothetical protein